MHLTYTFWQTWHLMDQTWHFCIGIMTSQFWYPEFPGLLAVCDLPTRCGSFPRGLLLPARTLLSPALPPPFFTPSFFFPRAQLGDTIHRRVLSFLHATELWRTATSWTGGPGGRDSQKRRWLATSWTGGDGRRKFPRRGKISHEARRTKKDPGQKYLGPLFWKMPSQKWQTLGDGLIFPLAKRLGTWQIPTNSKF